MSDTEFAKTHLRDHLASMVVPAISQGLWSIYDSAKELCDRNGQQDQTIRTFQNMLSKIPEWSDNTLDTEVDRIIKTSKCGYLDDLVMGVFIAYMKSFASLHYRGKSSQVSVDFDRPTLAKFVHHMYIHSARKVWQVAYLFKTIGVTTEIQARNRQEIESIVRECMERVIHSFLPWESITKSLSAPAEPIAEEDSSDEEEDSDEEETKEKKNVKFEDLPDEEEEEAPSKITLSDDVANIDVQEIDIPQPPPLPDVDPMEEITRRATESLVLKL
jgi:Family of unknown function (DUF5764)